jgi:hypothetical protein
MFLYPIKWGKRKCNNCAGKTVCHEWFSHWYVKKWSVHAKRRRWLAHSVSQSYNLHYSLAGKLGFTTCYDVRFPEMYVELERYGLAQIFLIPSAFTVPSDPWGWVITDAGGSYGPGTLDLTQESPSSVVCDVDVDEMKSIPERMPIQQHRDAAPFEWRLPFCGCRFYGHGHTAAPEKHVEQAFSLCQIVEDGAWSASSLTWSQNM